MFGTGHLKRQDIYIDSPEDLNEKKKNQLDLREKINNLPEICIEIDM